MRIVFLLLALMFFMGCAYFVSWENAHRNLIGKPVKLYVDLNGPPDKITPLTDGGSEYKYHLKKLDPSCIHYWVVNQSGIITGFRYEGYCRPIG